MKQAAFALALVLGATPAYAQLGGALGKLNKAKEQADKVKGLQISEAEERKIGEQVSAELCNTFGVVQDPAVTKYVSLVGSVLAQASSRPNLHWEFIVLDTDGVNAFASPGGLVHITRGALGLIRNEAELAGVLGHEITHVTEKHTVDSIQKSNLVNMGADQAGKGGLTGELISQIAQQAYKNILNNSFDRNDEKEADKVGVTLANKVGYAPSGLSAVLTKLADRAKAANQQEASGMFASHPAIKDRIDTIGKIIRDDKLNASATVAARYTKTITYDVKPMAEIATVADGSRGLAGSGGESKPPETKDEKKSGGLLGGRLGLTGGKETKSTATVASAGNRGLNPDRDAVGGPNKSKVRITLTPAEIDGFRKGIAG
jgi:beta-barrel assembly-enhancing protease